MNGLYLNNKKCMNHSNILLRITALWAFSEAFLGGILHGFKIPFAGLFLSLIAALCMCLMVVCGAARGGIVKATLAVIAVKFMLSPHTPPMAYFAVLIEGLAGELLFLQRRFIRLSAFVLTIFCLLYSAFQKLITTTLIFGKQFWLALNDFINGITKMFGWQQQQYVWWLLCFYVGCYALAGILGGVWNMKIVQNIQQGQVPAHIQTLMMKLHEKNEQLVTEKKEMKNKLLKKLWLPALFFLLLMASYTPLFEGSFLKHRVVEVLIRGALLIITWNFFISPLLVGWMSNWVEKYKTKQQTLLQQLILLMPTVKKIVILSWQQATNRHKVKKMADFISNTAMLIVYAK
jgi:hypothetical protein